MGVDIHLKSLLCAQRLTRKLVPGNEPLFVLADARNLPFKNASFGGVFSYSVIQHFSRANAAHILSEVKRVMKVEATSLVQMPNKMGLRVALSLARRRNSEESEFDVRYYTIDELLALFESHVGKSRWCVDCFLGLNVHARDVRLIPVSKRWIVHAAEALLSISKIVPPVARLADSIWIRSVKI